MHLDKRYSTCIFKIQEIESDYVREAGQEEIKKQYQISRSEVRKKD
jgi:hypothetical protein